MAANISQLLSDYDLAEQLMRYQTFSNGLPLSDKEHWTLNVEQRTPKNIDTILEHLASETGLAQVSEQVSERASPMEHRAMVSDFAPAHQVNSGNATTYTQNTMRRNASSRLLICDISSALRMPLLVYKIRPRKSLDDNPRGH